MSQTKQRTILLVDDQPEIRRLLGTMLTAKGCSVLSAENGEQAIRLFRENPDVDLLLTDVNTPGMSGPAIAAEIAALNPGIKVLFMTGYGDLRAVRRDIAERGYGLLFKPFTTAQLSAKIDDILAKNNGAKNNGEPDSAN